MAVESSTNFVKPYLLKISTTGLARTGANAVNYGLTILNTNTGEQKLMKVGSSAQTTVNINDLNDFPTGVTTGDVINVTLNDSEWGLATHTVATSKGGASVTLAATASTGNSIDA